MNNRIAFNQSRNPEGYWPSDEDVAIEAEAEFNQPFNSLSSEEQDYVIDGLIDEHYRGAKSRFQAHMKDVCSYK